MTTLDPSIYTIPTILVALGAGLSIIAFFYSDKCGKQVEIEEEFSEEEFSEDDQEDDDQDDEQEDDVPVIDLPVGDVPVSDVPVSDVPVDTHNELQKIEDELENESNLINLQLQEKTKNLSDFEIIDRLKFLESRLINELKDIEFQLLNKPEIKN